jgi:23S rRNA (guanine2445-N2)-methyltransferase
MGQTGDVERLFLQSPRGLEGVLALEAGRLGRARRVAGGVELEGGAGLHAEAALVLRVAERVLLRLVEGPARGWSEVERVLGAARLDGVAARGAAVTLEVAAVRAPGAPGRDALGALLSRRWARPVEPATGATRAGGTTRLVLRAAEGTVSLSADVAGPLLHRRGWRQEVSRAPMRETLAAGLLALAGHRAELPLWDPMCGSGTLVIEAALGARRIAPGLGRVFAAEAWPLAGTVDWSGLRERLRAAVRPRAPAVLIGSDLNAGALGTARRNARRAGVLSDLQLERLDVGDAAPGSLGPGLLIANLPYGRRVGARRGPEVFDTSVARVLAGPFAAWRRALLVDDRARLARAGGRQPDRLHPLVNGGIPVVLGIWEPTRGV